MSEWTIRLAKESDTDQLVELRLALQKHHENLNPQIWHLSILGQERLKDQFIQLLSDEDTRVFVAVDNSGAILGMIVGRIRVNDNFMPAITASIERLFVSPTWRERGIGTELVRSICQFFASRDVRDISSGYIAGNNEAEQFWSKLGFQPRIVTIGTNLCELP